MPPRSSFPPLPEALFTGPYGRERRQMVQRDLWERDIRDLRVLTAMARVPRHIFVHPSHADEAYADHPLAIGYGQTISQPYIVARIAELAEIGPGSRVLEIGVGSGYQTAVLLELGARVFGLEIIEPLADTARAMLQRLRYRNFRIIHGDGYSGFPGEAPYHAIVLAAAPEHLPRPLVAQLAPRGRIVAPIGPPEEQHLYVFTRKGEGLERQSCGPVRFVPMLGQVLDGEGIED